jgi:hypothetical protein
MARVKKPVELGLDVVGNAEIDRSYGGSQLLKISTNATIP